MCPWSLKRAITVACIEINRSFPHIPRSSAPSHKHIPGTSRQNGLPRKAIQSAAFLFRAIRLGGMLIQDESDRRTEPQSSPGSLQRSILAGIEHDLLAGARQCRRVAEVLLFRSRSTRWSGIPLPGSFVSSDLCCLDLPVLKQPSGVRQHMTLFRRRRADGASRRDGGGG